MKNYLAYSKYINFDDPSILSLAKCLAQSCSSEHEIIRKCFEYVKDEVKHSSDFKLDPVTCKASDVLLHKTGYCYAKSHLLAALLKRMVFLQVCVISGCLLVIVKRLRTVFMALMPFIYKGMVGIELMLEEIRMGLTLSFYPEGTASPPYPI